MARTEAFWLVFTLPAVAVALRGSAEGPEISGRVLLDGRPLAKAEVTFIPRGNDPSWPAAMARTTSSGFFQVLPHDDTGGTLPLGKYAVVVSKKVGVDRFGAVIPENDVVSIEQLEAAGRARESLPPRYSDSAEAVLWVEISAEPNLFQFELTSEQP